MATKVITDINIGVNTIDKAANDDIIVPKMPTNKQVVFLHKHFVKAIDGLVELESTDAIRKIKLKIPKPNDIQAAITINGIKPKANKTPITAPTIILITIPIQLQALKLHLPLQFMSFTPFSKSYLT